MYGDCGKQVIRRRRLRKIKETGGRAPVVGLGQQVQSRRRCCPIGSRIRDQEKITMGLERSSGVSGVPMI